VPELFERLARELGGLDLLVYAAGIMPKIARAEYDTGKDLDILAVNFAGLVAWGNAAAAYLGSRRSGAIVGLSSISGDRGRKGNPLYGASKAAMDNYLESLRNRLAELGVGVVTIKPGFVATRMTAGMDGLFWVITPEQAAEAILLAVRQRAGIRYVPRRWWCVAQVVKFIPSFVFKRLNF
jgi:NAD(P)-dependent dehydrogenase (short-subunit alcohol dehydrogenase family)